MTSPEQYVESIKKAAEQERKWCGAGPDGSVNCFNSPTELADWAAQIGQDQK